MYNDPRIRQGTVRNLSSAQSKQDHIPTCMSNSLLKPHLLNTTTRAQGLCFWVWGFWLQGFGFKVLGVQILNPSHRTR